MIPDRAGPRATPTPSSTPRSPPSPIPSACASAQDLVDRVGTVAAARAQRGARRRRLVRPGARAGGARGGRRARPGAPRARAVRTLIAEETRLGMLVGVAVGFELARELERSRDPRGLIDDGHPRSSARPASRSPTARHDRAHRPVPDRQPEGRRERRRGRRHDDPADPRARRPLRRHGRRSPSAPARPWWRSSSSPARSARRESRCATRTSAARSTFDWGSVKLVPAWHTSTTPEGDRHARRRPGDRLQGTSSTTSATRACSPTCSWSASASRSTSR